MKIWQKENKNIKLDKQIESFTIGNDNKIDLLLAPYDVIGTIAHVNMLKNIKILNDFEFNNIIKVLKKIYFNIINKNFKIEEGVEDIHSQIEIYLTNQLGDLGKKIHTGRSRNDQILLDIKLFTRNEIKEIILLINNLFKLLINLSEKYKSYIIPGYTHYQLAMPSSFGLWFSAYAESLVDDVLLLNTTYNFVNKNPLGSAAGYGTSIPLNRTLTTKLLGFDDLNYNVIYAQMCRGKTEKIVSNSISNIAYTLSKMSQDICLYMNQNFDFISFPDDLTTGSSIMPHKKNPDVFELIRAHCNQIIASSNEISLIICNLSSGYHRDFQILKNTYFTIFKKIKLCLDINKNMLKNIIIKKNIIKNKKYKYMFSVELVNKLVNKGLSFREAYIKIASDIKNNNYNINYDTFKIKHTHEGSINNLCNDNICNMMNKYIKLFSFNKIDNAIKKLLYE